MDRGGPRRQTWTKLRHRSWRDAGCWCLSPIYPTSPPPFTLVLFITCNLLSDEPRFSVYMLQSGSRPLQYFHKTNLHMRTHTHTHTLLQNINSTVNLFIFFLIFAMLVILSPLVLTNTDYQTGTRAHTRRRTCVCMSMQTLQSCRRRNKKV